MAFEEVTPRGVLDSARSNFSGTRVLMLCTAYSFSTKSHERSLSCDSFVCFLLLFYATALPCPLLIRNTRSIATVLKPTEVAQLATKGVLGEVVSTCERSQVRVSTWGFSFKVGICGVLPRRCVDLRLAGTTFWVTSIAKSEWSPSNLSGITNILHCFSLLSGLSINLKKSNLLGVGVRSKYVKDADAWEDTIRKLKGSDLQLELKTLSVGGRLNILKSVLGSTPIYNLSIYKAPKSVLYSIESLRRNFFNGSQCNERKIAWIKWTTTLASKKNGGLGISSLYALNRALLFKWVWRFISRDNSLWCRLILSMHGSKLPSSSPFRYSTWLSIIREIHSLKDRGVDSSVAVKLSSVTSSLRRPVRGGSESSQLSLLQEYIEGTILSSLEDRWVWDLNGEGVFCVKDVRNLLDDVFLPKAPIATRWIKYVPIKLNVFAWKVHLNRLPTRVNLQHRGVLVSDPSCPICHSKDEDLTHLFF
ncbi:RNA-directed DNA polymerase, eukaryota [Tanacetum coccineum]